jgi:hypothetical protein
MAYISPRPVPIDPTYSTLCTVRTLLATALALWLNTGPSDDVVDQEADATVALVRGLVALIRGAAI